MSSMDPGALPATWQEALENHSVTNVKVFEKQLRASTLRDKEKLRALVGSNYRELLSTAEQIAVLDEQNRQAEISISALGQACRIPDTLDTVSTPSKAAISASQIRLTDRLLRCASRATKDRSVLLASRLITIARLLVKHLEQDYGSSKTGQWLTIRLKNGRQQLLNSIDAMFVRPNTSLNQLMQAAGAYCLTTSSSWVDVTRHFRMLRAQKLAQQSVGSDLTKAQLDFDLRQRCHYFLASFTAIKRFSSRSVVDLLDSLQRRPILENRELLAIETLQLDTVKDLLPDDIRSFTPYFTRSNQLPSEIRVSQQQWTDEALKHLLKHIETTIQKSSLRSVLRTRQHVLDILLPNSFSTLSHGIIATSIRQLFSERIVKLIQQQAQTLETLGAEIPSVIESIKPPETSIWQSDLPRKVTAQPPPSCLRDIRRSHVGITTDLTTYLDKLRKWLLTCHQTKKQVEILSKIRWQDKIEEYDDEDEEVAAQGLVSSLSKADPTEYLETFQEAANGAADSFFTQINTLTSNLSQPQSHLTDDTDTDANTKPTTPSPSAIPTLLRITRETTHILTSLLPTKDLTPLHTATETLHSSLAQHISINLFESFPSDPLVAQSKSSFTPPDLPSPSAISLLRKLCTLMTEVGGIDIWTSSATGKVKSIVLERVLGTDSDVKERVVRSEIDEAYLRVALGGSTSDNGKEGELGNDQTEKEKGVDVDVQRRAAMLWSRSRLLFGVLGG